LKVFHEATRSDRGGEVVLRCEDKTGRVFFVGGKIAWVTVSTITRTFTDFLKDETSIGDEEVKGVYEECKRTGKNFGETLIEWGLIQEEELRSLLLKHFSECLLEIFSWEAVESMFIPEDRSYKGSLTFDFDELLESVMDMDQDGKLSFSGQPKDEIIRELYSEREATQPHIPSFHPDQPEMPEQAEAAQEMPAAEEEDISRVETQEMSVIQAEELAAFQAQAAAEAEQEQETAVEPEPLKVEPTQPIKKKGKGKLIAFTLILLILAAGGIGAYLFKDRLLEFIKGEDQADKPTTEIVDASIVVTEESVIETVDGGVVVGDQGTEKIDGGQQQDGQAVLEGDPGVEVQVAADEDLPAAADQETAAVVDEKVEEPKGIVAGAAGEGTGQIKVTSIPKRAKIYLDGIYTGHKTPFTLKDVPAGLNHVIMAEHKRRKPAFVQLRLEKDSEGLANLKLKKRDKRFKGRISVLVESEPQGASIYVNGGRVKKKTPTTLKLRADRASKLEVKYKGRKKWVRSVRPVPGIDLTYFIKF
jgi:uncharacterized protein DUF4388/PEGA domain-containing protein